MQRAAICKVSRQPWERTSTCQTPTNSELPLIDLSTLASFLTAVLTPPFQALRATFALPSTVLGPVDRSHGFHW
jgi:hypothetical protein